MEMRGELRPLTVKYSDLLQGVKRTPNKSPRFVLPHELPQCHPHRMVTDSLAFDVPSPNRHPASLLQSEDHPSGKLDLCVVACKRLSLKSCVWISRRFPVPVSG